MKTINEIITIINDAKINTMDEIEDLEGLSDCPFSFVDVVDIKERRWYVIGTRVYRFPAGFIGIRGPVIIKSESMTWEDCSLWSGAFEMIEVPSVTYKRKMSTASRK